MGEVQARALDELPFGGDTLEEHDQVQFEEDYGINRGPTAAGVRVGNKIAHERQIEATVKIPVEMVQGNRRL